MNDSVSRSEDLEMISLKRKRGNLHNTTRRFLFCSLVVGLLPLFGLTNQTSYKLRYTLRSPYTIYFIFSLFGQVFMFLTSLHHMFQTGISVDTITYLTFYTSSLISIIVLAHTGRCWPSLTKKVEEIENQLPPFRKRYNTIITVVMAFIMVSGAVEEMLYITYTITMNFFCNSSNFAENYFKVNSPWIFDYTSATMTKGLMIELFRLQSTFLWHYTDWLLILISLYLTEYFLVHNQRLKKAVGQKHFSCATLRTEYMKIVQVVKIINVQFGLFLILSVAGNIYWISTQLFYALNDGQSPSNQLVCEIKDPQVSKSMYDVSRYLYWPFTFTYVSLRALLVFQLTGRLHTTALVPLHILYNLPRSKFSIEVQRYMSQIKNVKIAVSGMDFFYMTKEIILSTIGTIVTYELVLFNFSE